MMRFDVADVTDMGNYYIINYITTNDRQFIEPGKTYFPITPVAAKKVQELKEDGKLVQFPKEVQHEIMPGDLIVGEVDDITREKDILIYQAINTMDEYLSMLSGLTLFEFQITNNVLIEAGYVITEDNREEKYLEIISSENEKLISTLETFLNAKDKIDEVYWRYNKFLEFKQELSDKETDDINELKEIYNQYISAIKNPI